MARSTRLLALALLALLCSGCFFLPSAVREETTNPGEVRWWCRAPGAPALDQATCRKLSAGLDVARDAAYRYPKAGDAAAAGAVAAPYAAGAGVRFVFAAPHAFGFMTPDTLLYTGTGAGARLAGIEWNVPGSAPPEGFAGNHDVWTEVGGAWRLRAWIVRPFERHGNVFATSHPCLAAGGAVLSVGAPCYVSTHTDPLRVLVSNDDGFGAAGIDAVVEALRALPGVTVTVVAPATNQSGAGEKTTDGPLTATSERTRSGYPATAVVGYPADSIIYALRDLHLNPDLVVTGLNEGQNLGPFVNVSGTVGAARRAARNGIPSVATSQGFGVEGAGPDYASGVVAMLAWVRDFRLGRVGAPLDVVGNVNIPSCAAGSSVRGTVVVPVAAALDGRPYGPGDCRSTRTAPVDDIDAFNWGYVTRSDAGLG